MRVPEVHSVRVWVGERVMEPLEVTEVEPEKEVVPVGQGVQAAAPGAEKVFAGQLLQRIPRGKPV